MSLSDLTAGWKELSAALPGYLEAERYFKGTVDEVFTSPKIQALIASTGARYRFNLIKTAVTVLASRIELLSVHAVDDEAATELIRRVWTANDWDIHFPDLVRRTMEFGDAYVMAWPSDLDDVGVDEDQATAGVELTVHDPKHCRAIYDPENERRMLFVIKRWHVPSPEGGRWRADLYFADALESWVSRDGQDPASPQSWLPFTDDLDTDEDGTAPNPFGEIPFWHYRTDLPYGVPEHFAGYGCQDALNKMLVTQLTTTDSHGWPQRYALTDKGAALDEATDGPGWDDDSTDDTPLGGGAESALRTGPGTVMALNGMKAVGQFAAAEPRVFTDPATTYIRLMAQVTETPLHAFDPSGDAPSGESLKVAEAPLVKKTERREAMFRAPTVSMWRFVLRVLGVKPPALDVRWAAARSATGKADWEAVTVQQAAGVPVDQTLIEAGYPAEQVADWAAARSAPTPPPQAA